MSTIATTFGAYVLVEAVLPGYPSETIGVLLVDPEADRLFLRFRRDLDEIAEPEDAEVLESLAADLEAKAAEMGAGALLTWLEDHLFNVIRISDREECIVDDFDRAADRLYRRFITPKVLPFRTHVPIYSLKAAAGKFGENMEVEEAGWEELKGDLKEDMFVAQVVGHSMEPRIPDGSWCLFRGGVAGSRNGRLVLVMNYGETGESRFTIKRYKSTKSHSDEGWVHDKIVLEPLNPEFDSWELTPNSRIAVVAEFITIIRPPE